MAGKVQPFNQLSLQNQLVTAALYSTVATLVVQAIYKGVVNAPSAIAGSVSWSWNTSVAAASLFWQVTKTALSTLKGAIVFAAQTAYSVAAFALKALVQTTVLTAVGLLTLRSLDKIINEKNKTAKLAISTLAIFGAAYMLSLPVSCAINAAGILYILETKTAGKRVQQQEMQEMNASELEQ